MYVSVSKVNDIIFLNINNYPGFLSKAKPLNECPNKKWEDAVNPSQI